MGSEIEIADGTIFKQAAHDPAPRIELVDLPDRTGQAFLRKVNADAWDVVKLEGPREGVSRHTMRSLGGFVRWLKAFASDSAGRAQIFVEAMATVPVAAKIAAKIDPGDPDGDRVVCEVGCSPDFVAWVARCNGKTLSQKALFGLVRGYGEAIKGEGAMKLLAVLASLRVVGNSTLECELAPNGRVRVKGVRADVKIDQELPGEIDLELPIFQGVTDGAGDELTYSVRALLDVEASAEDGLSIGITFPGIEAALLVACEDLVAHVQRELGEAWTVCLGSEKTESVLMRGGVSRIGIVPPIA